MPRLACIIPVVGSVEGLESTLLSVLERRPDDCEVLVVLNTPYHDPYDLRGEIRFLQAPAKAGFVACVNLGIAATQATIVHILATGFEATEGWIERAVSHFDDPRVGTVTPLVYNFANQDELLAAGIEYHIGGRKTICRSHPAADESQPRTIGPWAKAAFYRKSALESLAGGFSAAVGNSLADADFALSLRRAGWRNVIEPACRVMGTTIDETSPAGFSAGLHNERLFWRHFGQANRLLALVSHVLVVLRDFTARPFWKLPNQLFGRLIACCQFGHYRQYQQLISAAAHTVPPAIASQGAVTPTLEGDSAPKPVRQHRIDESHSVRPAKTRAAQTARRQ